MLPANLNSEPSFVGANCSGGRGFKVLSSGLWQVLLWRPCDISVNREANHFALLYRQVHKLQSAMKPGVVTNDGARPQRHCHLWEFQFKRYMLIDRQFAGYSRAQAGFADIGASSGKAVGNAGANRNHVQRNGDAMPWKAALQPRFWGGRRERTYAHCASTESPNSVRLDNYCEWCFEGAGQSITEAPPSLFLRSAKT
jgi:hypothetical protein